MPLKPGPVEEPMIEELDKLDTKPAADVMAPDNLICTIDGCTFKTSDQTVAASVLNNTLHS